MEIKVNLTETVAEALKKESAQTGKTVEQILELIISECVLRNSLKKCFEKK